MKPDPPAPPLAGTAMACTTVLLAFMSALFVLTGGFEHWTFEDQRRDDARQARLLAPAIQVRTAQGTQRTLWSKSASDPSVTLVNFIYTSCPTVCQTLGAEYTQMQHALAAEGGAVHHPIELVSLSFDVEHDGPAQLSAYAQRHRADPNAWTIAAPLAGEDAKLLLRALGVVVIPDGAGGYVHNGAIHLLDASGTVLAIYDDADWEPALAMALRVSRVAR